MGITKEITSKRPMALAADYRADDGQTGRYRITSCLPTIRPERISEFSECRPGLLATILLLRCGKSAHPLPSECPDLPHFRGARPHHNSQFVARYLELAYEISSYIGDGKRTFEVVCNGVIGFVYGVRTKICFVSVEQLGTVITRNGVRGAAINCCGTVRSQELHSHVPACVVHQITFGCGPEAFLKGSAVLQPNNSGDEPPCTYQLSSAT